MFPTSINGNLTKIDIYNKKVIEGFMLEYKQSFHSALLWVKLREKISQFLRKESTKSSPGMTNLIFQVLSKLADLILQYQIFGQYQPILNREDGYFSPNLGNFSPTSYTLAQTSADEILIFK